MKPLPIPVRVVGPGSQPEDEQLQFLGLPSSMATFSMPQVPEQADPRALLKTRNLLAEFARKMAAWDGAGAPRLALDGLEAATVEVLNDMLGSGEVSVRIKGEREVRIQESVFAGVWRILRYSAQGVLESDSIEASPMPEVVTAAARAAAGQLPPAFDLPAGAMNSPALVTEIREQARRHHPGRSAHVINLSLLPLAPEDHRVLEQVLPVGPVAIISKSFGNCRVTSTGVRNVWRVQYFNSMQTMILNTIEVVDLPEVAQASGDDLADSRERIEDLVGWISESCPA